MVHASYVFLTIINTPPLCMAYSPPDLVIQSLPPLASSLEGPPVHLHLLFY